MKRASRRKGVTTRTPGVDSPVSSEPGRGPTCISWKGPERSHSKSPPQNQNVNKNHRNFLKVPFLNVQQWIFFSSTNEFRNIHEILMAELNVWTFQLRPSSNTHTISPKLSHCKTRNPSLSNDPHVALHSFCASFFEFPT